MGQLHNCCRLDDIKKEMARSIQDKYDQLNKDIFDFKDTLTLVQQEQQTLKTNVKRISYVIAGVGFYYFINYLY